MAEGIQDWDTARLRAFIQSEINGAGNSTSDAKKDKPATILEQFGGLDFPTGIILSWAGLPASSDDVNNSVDPPGWMVCDGRGLKRAEFPALFMVIGTEYDDAGSYVGTDSFPIPDLRANALMGQSFFIPGSVPDVGLSPGGFVLAHSGDTEPHWDFVVVTYIIKT